MGRKDTVALVLFALFALLAYAGEMRKIELNFPARAELCLKVEEPGKWDGASFVRFMFQAQSALPEHTKVSCFTKDGDNLWRQVEFATVPQGDSEGNFCLEVPLRGREAIEQWKCGGHGRPWNCLTARHLREYGFIFEAAQDYKGAVLYKGLEFSGRKVKCGERMVYDFSVSPASLRVGEIQETTFRLDAWPQAPFDCTKAVIRAKFFHQDGTSEERTGFYYEDFAYDDMEWDKTRCLVPRGEPCFKVRYCPRKAGHYTLKIDCEIDGAKFHIPQYAFEVQPPPQGYHGFIRTDARHTQYCQYEDGTIYSGIGMNVRSPYDKRYYDVAPYSTWQDMGLHAYEHLFKRFAEAGIDLVEVWMCSWWLALEWINDSPGFHGVGHYNQYRAWMLDYIFSLADKYGLKVILVINNHGKFAMHYDTEWKRNPYNRVNGGYLGNCEEYYTNDRAREDTKKLLTYISARWGARPNLLAWKLFTEVDLTGPNLDYYRNPVVTAWHKEMGDFLKKTDIYQHLVTTHWMLGYSRINKELAVIPELDIITTDAYYNLGEGTGGLVNLLKNSRNFARGCNKPMLITEFGGSSYGDSMSNFIKQFTVGTWLGYFCEFVTSPMYWWFALVEDQDLYSVCSAFSKFIAGEDRRGMAPSFEDAANGELEICQYTGKNRVLAWVYDKSYYLPSTENLSMRERRDVVLSIPAPEPGKYRLQICDSQKGALLSTQWVTVKDKRFEVKLPMFKGHIAFKLIAADE